MLMDDNMQGKAKVFGKGVKNPHHHNTVLTKEQHHTLHTETRRRPEEKRATVSNGNTMPEILIRVLKPSWATGRFSTSGMWDCSRWEAREWIKSQTRRWLYFKKGRYNCIIQGENIIMPQRWELLFEVVLKEHRELKMCLVACISTTTLNQSLDL